MHVKINVFTVEFILYVFGTKICLFYLYFYYSLYNTRCNICFWRCNKRIYAHGRKTFISAAQVRREAKEYCLHLTEEI